MERLSDLTERIEQRQKAAARVGWALGSDTHLAEDPVSFLRQVRLSRFVKSTALTTAEDVLASTVPMDAALLAAIDDASLLGSLPGAVRIPLTAAARIQVAEISAAAVGEAEPKPVERLEFTAPGPPSKIPAQILISAEALRAIDLPTLQGITAVLASAVGRATDAALVAVLTAGTTAGVGFSALLAAISGGQARRPVLIGGLGDLLGLTPGTIRDLEAVGIRVVASPAAAGMLVALDESGLLVSDGDLTLQSARHASIDLAGGSPAGALTSLWQSNLTALRCERLTRFAVRAGAVQWASTGSPA